MQTTREMPAFLRGPDQRLDLGASARRVDAERRARRHEIAHRFALGAGFAATLILGTIAANAATDWLVGHCLWPGMAGCEVGEAVFAD